MTRSVKQELVFAPPFVTGSSNSRNGVNNGQTETSATERKLLRSRYRDVTRIIIDEREEVGRVDSDKFDSIISQVEDLHKSVQKPREQVADAWALLDITNSLVASVKAHGSDGIMPSDFVNCILRDFGQRDRPSHRTKGGRNLVAWEEIGGAVSYIFGCSGCSTMIGPMDTELRLRKVRVRGRCMRPAESAPPEAVDNSGAEERTDTDRNMATMFNILKNKRTVKLENLVLNRNSFAQTVENLFALSFLVKDGRAEIEVKENGWHFVSPRNAPEASKVVSGEVAYSSFVFRLDFKDWKLMMSTVEVGEELMPHRKDINMPNDSQPESKPAESVGAGPTTSVPEESEGAGPTAPIWKFSRNRGLVLRFTRENSSPESDDPQCWKGKRKDGVRWKRDGEGFKQKIG